LVYSRGAGVIIGNSGATNKYLQVNGPLTANGNINLAGASGRRIYMGGVGGTTFGMAYDAANPNYGIFYTEATPDYVSISPNGNANNGVMNVFGDGKVGIGTSSPGSYTLAVEGKIGAREVNVIATNPWPDYVFEKNYTLPTLESIKAYIDQNKHLPEVPSATEVEKNGVNLGEMNALLLKKIEELTLYILKQEERALEQEKRISALEEKK
ncbi:MAG: hypothetical protein HYR67_02050, partial [Bacteroidetes bacterium]|nr:hypothetical protein [Bacteroidota bacterium]